MIKIFRTPESWIEGEALRQLQVTFDLPGMLAAYGMPDLHPGRGHPIGASFLTEHLLYPYLVGSDIGCGMALFYTGIPARKAKRDKWTKSLNIDGIWDDRDAKYFLLDTFKVDAVFVDALGTIGLGNHFAELLTVNEVLDHELFSNMELDKKLLYLLVHSGSRGFGDAILRAHTEKNGAKGLDAESVDGSTYLSMHNMAVKWAEANRTAIATRFGEQIGCDPIRIIDLCHNSVTPLTEKHWLHRKGAAPHGSTPVMIPGSRGDLSYLVQPKGCNEAFGYSLPHGAGRKWARADARSRLKDRYHVDELIITKMGSSVICEDKDLLYEEAPEAYKEIAQVINDMTSLGMAEVIATFKPLITYKTRAD